MADQTISCAHTNCLPFKPTKRFDLVITGDFRAVSLAQRQALQRAAQRVRSRG